MFDEIQLNLNENIQPRLQINNRVGGFTIDALNQMVYNGNLLDDNDENLNMNNIRCNYVLSKDIQLDNGINVMSFNIGSMQTNFDNFVSELVHGDKLYDIIGVCETHLTDATANVYNIDHFNLFTNNVASNMGGVCIYIRDDLNCKIRDDLMMKKDHIETLFLETIIDNRTLLIGSSTVGRGYLAISLLRMHLKY